MSVPASESVSIAVVQTQLSDDRTKNVKALTQLCRDAKARGANVILLPELFEGWYFCQSQLESDFARAQPAQGNPTIAHFQELAAQLKAVIPVSFFERDEQCYYNSLAMIDATGEFLGVYRKSHIPDGPGYQEKFFFRPGNTGFRTWQTKFGNIGVGICWDQWFPEAARAMALAGADILLYPTAIGSEPEAPDMDTAQPWQRAMIGHAVSNACVVAAANRVGRENGIDFYGSSFISDHRGEKVAELNRSETGVAVAQINLPQMRTYRAGFGFFRDRRPELYTSLVES